MNELNQAINSPWFMILAAINICAFLIMGLDKLLAKCHAWRVPEKVLMSFCLLFGAAGGYLGMNIFRHKTRKFKFAFTVPVLLVIQVALIAGYFYLQWRK